MKITVKSKINKTRCKHLLATAAILNGGWGSWTQFCKGPTQEPSLPGLV